MRRKLITVLGGAGALVLAMAGPAAAHIEPTIEEAPAGGEVTFALIVPHGCDDPAADTTGLEVQMPDGVEEVVPEAVPGWDVTVRESDPIVVSWEGGPLPDGQFQEFGLSVAMPDTPGETLLFPTIQSCGNQEVSWIEETPEGGEEPEHPAPAITLTEAAADQSHSHDEGDGEEPTGTTAADGDKHDGEEASAETGGHDDGTDALAVVALIVGTLGLVLGAYSVVALRRAS